MHLEQRLHPNPQGQAGLPVQSRNQAPFLQYEREPSLHSMI